MGLDPTIRMANPRIHNANWIHQRPKHAACEASDGAYRDERQAVEALELLPYGVLSVPQYRARGWGRVIVLLSR